MFAALVFAVVVLAVAFVAYHKGRAQGKVDAQRAMRLGEHLTLSPPLHGRNGERVTLIRVTPPGHG
jgi:hypothetical protein